MAYKSAQILLAVLSLRPGLKPNVDFELAEMGEGPFISVWNREDVTQPTPTEIQAVDTDALLASDIVVSRLQFRKMLRGSNRVAAFLTYVNGASAEVKDYWELSDRFQRTDIEIEALRIALSLTLNQMNAAFSQAQTL